jgi:RNA recognition motif-containing protein
LFVANLPFSVNDEQLAKLFADAGVATKSAHVVVKRNGRSKGFGFVEFDQQADQVKALNALNNKPVDGRDLIVKIALADARRQAEAQEAAAAGGSTGAAAAAAQPTAAAAATPAAAQK